MSAPSPNEKERPAVSDPNAPSEATPAAETVICGRDGRVRITFTEPAPAAAQVKAQEQPEDVLAFRPKRSHWRDILRRDGKPRWQTNRRSAQ